MNPITRRFEFDAAHRVLGHGGKCRFLHGHRYVAEVSVVAPKLDNLDMVVDFSVLKREVGDFIDSKWDHNILLHKDDPQRVHLDQTEERLPFTFDRNPTAEVIAETLFYIAKAMMKTFHIEVVKVRIYETPNCWADYDGTGINHDNNT